MNSQARPAPLRCLRLLAALATTAFALPDAAAQGKAEAAPDTTGLPAFLQIVPGGQVSMGMSIDQLVQAACEGLNPRRPELALKETEKVARALRHTLSQLGNEKRTVPTFLLGRWPVTNKEYAVFVGKMAATANKVKPPFHWWRIGRKDDYDQKLEDINREFKAEGKMGPVYYWERHGDSLPYKLVDDRGQGIDDHPVVYVSYRDALRFAGWLGMRLPTEEEWTRAARGDADTVWPWGGNKQYGDKFSEEVLGALQLAGARDRHTKPVGTVPFLTGPFGHVDMVAQVWEYTSNLTYAPISGQKAFELEWKRAQKDKVGALVATNLPLWKDGRVIVKGGSYLSWSDPIQLEIDCREALQTNEALESVGFRLAKSLKPGFDLMISLVTSDYNMDLFATGADAQKVAFEQQVGCERYVLEKDGFPSEYHAVSAAPVAFLSADKNMTLAKLEDQSQQRPLLLGTLVTTEPLLQPKLPEGIYSVAYRKAGKPKELHDAIKAGYKEVQAELRRKAHGGETEEKAEEPKKDDKKAEDAKRNDWRSILSRYGLTEKDLEPKGADDSLKVVRYTGYEVPVDQDLYLFLNNEGKFVAHCAAGGLTAAALVPGELAMTRGKVDKAEHAKVEIKLRGLLLKDQKKAVEYKLELLLEQAPPADGETWRLPAPAAGG